MTSNYLKPEVAFNVLRMAGKEDVVRRTRGFCTCSTCVERFSIENDVDKNVLLMAVRWVDYYDAWQLRS